MSSQQFVRLDSLAADMSDRLAVDTTVDASPAAAAETIIATLPALAIPRAEISVLLVASFGFTVGTNGTASTVRIRRTNAAGAVVYNSGAISTAAASLFNPAVVGVDVPGVQAAQVYVLTLQVTAASATSTVSAVAFAGVLL